ncbi:hypothetical protein HDU90_004276 [Geranomyces variabilis]|nr:hypothetical protein HDU90_004276 [Geranomyces variabilis]
MTGKAAKNLKRQLSDIALTSSSASSDTDESIAYAKPTAKRARVQQDVDEVEVEDEDEANEQVQPNDEDDEEIEASEDEQASDLDSRHPPPWKAAVDRVLKMNERTGLLWKRIIDLDDPDVCSKLGPSVVKDIEQRFIHAQTYDEVTWSALPTKTNDFLRKIAKIQTSALISMGKQGFDEGAKWMIKTIYEAPEIQPRFKRVPRKTSSASRPRSGFSSRTASSEGPESRSPGQNIAPELDNDLRYILRMLEKTAKLITERTEDTLSERDGDALFHWDLFSVVKPETTIHYGEVMSRASQNRRVEALRRSNKVHTKSHTIRGALLDFLFSKESHETDLGWGVEIGAAANAGMTRSKLTKKVTDRIGLATVLRDMHCALVRSVQQGPCKDSVVRHLLMHGALMQNWTMQHVLVVYVGYGTYAVRTVTRAQIPTKIDAFFGKYFTETMRLALRFREGLVFTKDLFLTLVTDQDASDGMSQTSLVSSSSDEAFASYEGPDHINTPAKRKAS